MGIIDALNNGNKKNKSTEIGQPKTAQLNLDEHQGFKFEYDKDWEKKEFLSTVEEIDVKKILHSVRNQPIELANGYSGYLQIMEIYGNDIASLSNQEQAEVIAGYTQWLAGTPFDFGLQTTTLPTNTREQIEDLIRILNDVRNELGLTVLDERKRMQLRQRQDILIQNIVKLEIVAARQYNTEFFVWIFGDTLEELENNTRIAQEASYLFTPHIVSVEKKEQILKQYYNYNEVV
ncbi:hypothetical protein [Streptococcus sp. DTU_2020_1000888_1_SI_GRL_NUU_041A]|uniref:hypothetical protein n=1 Tax=Streptococcus sp. DTU_2020_1000888_1_SI_GRL_NUU_041A TaxID=3077723 RepID=UPI0028E429FE|nr:hypothetical protein [Streptococcus sp. DTU_2020_1000888_1_SI_GRL_NUU_041A]WNU96025.1 hypothetical protein RSK81_12695 [Streptococcus sp. DTU_2020_1000888_1_SI_GRL_NUU_041A]